MELAVTALGTKLGFVDTFLHIGIRKMFVLIIIEAIFTPIDHCGLSLESPEQGTRENSFPFCHIKDFYTKEIGGRGKGGSSWAAETSKIEKCKVKLIYVKMLFDAQSKTLNVTLFIDCCDELFKAYLRA